MNSVTLYRRVIACRKEQPAHQKGGIFMSVVVAIKEKNRIYIGADSQVTKGGTRTTLKNPNNYKIWKVDGSENCLMGHVGNLRDSNIIRLMRNVIDDYDEFYKRVDYRFIVSYLVPEIVKRLKEAQFVKCGDNYIDYIDSSFLFAYKDVLFFINTDLSVIEIDDYIAIGSGANEAIGSLHSTVGQDPLKRIIKAIKSSAANDIYVDYPIIISDTETTQFEVITEKNESKFLYKTKKEGDSEESSGAN